MINFIRGILIEKELSQLVLECNSIGYEVKISLNTYGEVPNKGEVKLFTYLMIREDAHTLFGFSQKSEKILFLSLIKISGVGGNTALTILSSMSPSELESIIETDNVNALKKVKGIGAKTASRIILELKGKLVLDPGDEKEGTSTSLLRQEALSALVNLGFPKTSMEKMVDKVIASGVEDISVEKIIKLALKG